MTREEQLAHYEATLERYVRGEATSAEVAAADPYDAALRRIAERAYERRNPPREEVPVDWWHWLIIGAAGMFLFIAAGWKRPKK